jgi:hypothetical protein
VKVGECLVLAHLDRAAHALKVLESSIEAEDRWHAHER